MRINVFLAMISLCWLPCVMTSSAQTVGNTSVRLNFRTEQHVDLNSAFRKYGANMSYFYLSNGQDHVAELHNLKGSDFEVSLSKDIPPGDRSPDDRSLFMALKGNQTLPKPDKVMLAVAPFDSPSHLSVDGAGRRRYVAFNFKLGAGYQVPKEWVLHAQVWQECGGHPPFTISSKTSANPNATPVLRFGTRDNINDPVSGHPEYIFLELPIERNVWHRLILSFEPASDSSAEKGQVKVWLDGRPVGEYDGHWGYDRRSERCKRDPNASNMGFELGVYRQKQIGMQSIYFNNIIYTANPKDVGV